MNILEAMQARHSVRQYIDKPIDETIVLELENEIRKCNEESGLNIQLIINEQKAFKSLMAHYGKFSGVSNYIALIGKKDLDEQCGYYGERIVLLAQMLGLNTCWVALTYKKIKTAFTINKDEKLYLVIAIGYGENQGVQHKSKAIENVTNVQGTIPDWFKNGTKAALLAPTALNQQKFMLSLNENQVSLKAGKGFYTKIDLGIVKYHFEKGAGIENFKWRT